MAKGLGLIGNFSGKVGNTVGYNLKDSNNKQTQGVRVYQPVVRNPKTSSQAEQRARMDVINATYRALKAIIQRGQEGEAYGNKSRLAWLSKAMKNYAGAWINKGEAVNYPAIVALTKGSLSGISVSTVANTGFGITITAIGGGGTPNLGALSTAILSAYPALKAGDQVTFVIVRSLSGSIMCQQDSIILDATSEAAIPATLSVAGTTLTYAAAGAATDVAAGCIIVSREGSNGEHLRSNASLVASSLTGMSAAMTDAAKTAAIQSYMAAGTSSDWAEVVG